MDTNDLDQLVPPKFEGIQHHRGLKVPILNSTQSAVAGFWLVLVPALFLALVTMKYYFMINLHFFDLVEDSMANLDKSAGLKWISPVLLVAAPIAGLVVNLLAILHVVYQQESREIVLTVKLRWLNLVFVGVSLVILFTFFLYLITENIHHLKGM